LFYFVAVKDAWAVSWIWGDVNVGTFLPIDIPIPPMPEWTGMYDAIPELNDFFDLAASPSYAKLLNSVDAVRDGVHQAIDGFRDEIQFNLVYGFPDMLPEDYEPPQYIGGRSDVRNLASEEELHDNVTKVGDIHRAELLNSVMLFYYIFIKRSVFCGTHIEFRFKIKCSSRCIFEFNNK
jgi:hypothetical protein